MSGLVDVLLCNVAESEGGRMKEKLIIAAIKWFDSHRPIGDSLEQHLANPRVNTTTGPEGDLAESIADYIVAKLNGAC